jgi:hypothetical protein
MCGFAPVAAPHPPDLVCEQRLLLPLPQVLDHRVTDHDVEALVLEWERAAIPDHGREPRFITRQPGRFRVERIGVSPKYIAAFNVFQRRPALIAAHVARFQ